MRNDPTTNEMLTRKDNFLLGSVSLVVCMIQCDAPGGNDNSLAKNTSNANSLQNGHTTYNMNRMSWQHRRCGYMKSIIVIGAELSRKPADKRRRIRVFFRPCTEECIVYRK